MTDENLTLDPGRVTSGGRGLTAAGEHLTAQRRGPGAELAALSGGRPWGNDEIGQAFDNNYRPIETQVLAAWEKLGGYLEGLGDTVVEVVQEATATDQHSAVQVERSYRKLP